jgi:hypothetical protein
MFPARLSLLMLSCTLDSDSVRDHAPTNPAAELLSRETQAAARMLGIEIHLIDVRLMGLISNRQQRAGVPDLVLHDLRLDVFPGRQTSPELVHPPAIGQDSP